MKIFPKKVPITRLKAPSVPPLAKGKGESSPKKLDERESTLIVRDTLSTQLKRSDGSPGEVSNSLETARGTSSSLKRLPPLYERILETSEPREVSPLKRRGKPKVSIPLLDMGFYKVHRMGITGKGVTVAIIDSGVRADHPDLEGKVIKWVDESGGSDKPYDDIGHGTHVAGIIAGSGRMSKGFYRGGAPGVKLVVIRVTNPAEVLKAIDWIKKNKDKYNIRVVNMSIGVDPSTSWKDDPLAKGAQELVDSGITVVAAAGNDYERGTIDSPGVAPGVITVGGADDKRTYTQTDDTLYIASSKGPTPIDNLPKPDVIAYSTRIVSLRSPGSFLDPYESKRFSKAMIYKKEGNLREGQASTSEGSEGEATNPWSKGYYIELSGTSQGTAWVSALAALLYQVNPNLTPQEVKRIIMETATPLRDPDTGKPYDRLDQGAGLINAYRAVKMAMRMRDDGQRETLVIAPLSQGNSVSFPLPDDLSIEDQRELKLKLRSGEEERLGYFIDLKGRDFNLSLVTPDEEFNPPETLVIAKLTSRGGQGKAPNLDLDLIEDELLEDKSVLLASPETIGKALEVPEWRGSLKRAIITFSSFKDDKDDELKELIATLRGKGMKVSLLLSYNDFKTYPALSSTLSRLKKLKGKLKNERLEILVSPGPADKSLLSYVVSRLRGIGINPSLL